MGINSGFKGLNIQAHLHLHAPPNLTFQIFNFIHTVPLWVLCDF